MDNKQFKENHNDLAIGLAIGINATILVVSLIATAVEKFVYTKDE